MMVVVMGVRHVSGRWGVIIGGMDRNCIKNIILITLGLYLCNKDNLHWLDYIGWCEEVWGRDGEINRYEAPNANMDMLELTTYFFNS